MRSHDLSNFSHATHGMIVASSYKNLITCMHDCELASIQVPRKGQGTIMLHGNELLPIILA